eukprot:scaffold4013_cov429-Prasinococcus_capsulatus_cf.AAC.1
MAAALDAEQPLAVVGQPRDGGRGALGECGRPSGRGHSPDPRWLPQANAGAYVVCMYVYVGPAPAEAEIRAHGPAESVWTPKPDGLSNLLLAASHTVLPVAC